DAGRAPAPSRYVLYAGAARSRPRESGDGPHAAGAAEEMTKRGGSNGNEPADQALWEAVKKSVKPLRNPKPRALKPAILAATPGDARAPKQTKQAKSQAVTAATPAAPKPPPLANLDRRTRSRVARGRVEIDARLDLHGLT